MIGLAAVVVGVFLAATASAYNGQWLLGALIAGAGMALLWYTRKDDNHA